MDVSRVITTNSPQATQKFGQKFGVSILKTLSTNRGVPVIICLWGELGSGKTTFVQGFARGLGITSRILSPTFIIVRRYKIPKSMFHFYHMDLYRIDKEIDVTALGFSEMSSDTNSLVVLEWPQRLGDLLPKSRIDIRFSLLSNQTHKIEVHSYGHTTGN